MTERAARPRAIPIIGWGWVALGILMAINGGMALMMSSFGFGRGTPPGGPWVPAFVWRHFTALVGAQLLVAVLVVAGAVALLQNKRWGAAIIRATAWCGLLYIIGVSGYFVSQALGFAVSPGGVSETDGLGFFLLAALVSLLLQGTPLLLTLYFLGQDAVRDALA